MRNKILTLLAVGLLAEPVATLATPIVTPIGNATISGIEYKVSLLSDISYDLQSLNLLAPSLTFADQSSATAAASALLAVFGAGYDWNPTCTACLDGFRVLFSIGATTYDYMTGSAAGGPNGPWPSPLDEGNHYSFAQFQIANSVPEPGTLALMGLGLAGVAIGKRRKQA